MTRPRNNFERALKDAEKRLETALRDRDLCCIRLTNLNIEIPALQRTIGALQAQLDPEARPITERAPSPVAPVPPAGIVIRSTEQFDKDHGIPPIPDVLKEMTEDELLPDPEGTPLIPED